MPIRGRNLDFNTDIMKRSQVTSLGDISATLERGIFVAPVACVVDQIDIYSGQGVSGTSASAQMTIRVQSMAVSGSQLQVRGTSATASTSNDILANTRYRLTPSANNSLSVGTPLEINFSAGGSGVLSAVVCIVTYTPLIHRESR